MNIISNIKQWQEIRNNLNNSSIGFVPTMGCLHQGHLALINHSVKQNDVTVLSIFVNPTQFNDANDYQHYPKTLNSDLELAQQSKVDYVITPDVNSMYPDGNTIHFVTNHPLSTVMEGQFRPGHYNGVLTIVMKLLMLIRPSRVYFGEKDYQQYFLIDELIKKYFIQTEIVLCPTVREPSGLPFSSRNMRLAKDERNLVEQFYNFFYGNHSQALDKIKQKLSQLKIDFDYLEVFEQRLFFALKIGGIRIIDNIRLAPCSSAP